MACSTNNPEGLVLRYLPKGENLVLNLGELVFPLIIVIKKGVRFPFHPLLYFLKVCKLYFDLDSVHPTSFRK